MYHLSISPQDVQKTLEKHILADGYDLTYDMEKSQGVYMFDSKHQKTYLDFFTCFASVPLGYNHPKMVNDEAFTKNLLLAALANPSNSDVYTQQYAEFVKTFSEVGIPDYLPHAFFVAGGSLAVENAIKTAMDWKVQKNFAKGYKEEKGFKVIHFEQAFHGRSGYTLSLTNTLPDKTKWFAKFDWPRVSNPKINFPRTEENEKDLIDRENFCLSQIKSIFVQHPDEVCAIILEPIQSEGGDHHFTDRFLVQLKNLAVENEALLIYDEVQTGVGLSGKFWCHQNFSEAARPDIIAFGKKMQVCGILAGKRVDEVETNVFRVPSRINSTWGGNLVDMVRCTKVLQIIKEDQLCDNASKVGAYLQQKLHGLAEKFDQISNVRGTGFITAFDFPSTEMRNQFVKLGMEHNAMFLGCGNKTIRFRPALMMEEKHIDEGTTIIEKILTQL